jgi:2-polyprenyl-3-methyl-5-hydroxy-6-metoxy-1,4-benzoquinol methylase
LASHAELRTEMALPDSPDGAARPIWYELSHPRTVAEKGLANYYHFARPELVNLLSHTPRVVLDIGCAGGATGMLLKQTYPGTTVHGIEINEEAASLASTRLDRVLRENVEKLDFLRAGFEHGSVDAVFLPDVLEHLYDPWHLLLRLKPFLSTDAQVIASVPNSRNLWLIAELSAGNFDYEEAGLLDVTHIRFFTRKTALALFTQTGYSITRLGANIDGRIPELVCPQNGTIDINLPRLTFKAINAQDALELRTLQFVIDAKPVA